MTMDPEFIVVHEAGTAQMHGLQHPNAKVLARDAKSIAIKVPSHYYAMGVRGMGRGYAPAETLVFRIKRSRGVAGWPFSGHGEGLDVELILRWSHEGIAKK
jgi:hypothetical protein